METPKTQTTTSVGSGDNNASCDQQTIAAATLLPTTTITTTPTAHHRIPFVHRLSSFRRNHHGSKPNSQQQQQQQPSLSDSTAAAASSTGTCTSITPITKMTKEDFLSSDLILKVAVIRGKSLTREDEANIPNPYVNVRCGGIRQRTDTIKKCPDPEWLCNFEFNLSTDIIGHKKRLRALKRHGLSVTVYSKDRFSSIFLGQINWSLDQLFPSDSESSLAFDDNSVKWYPLAQTSQQHKRFHLRRRRNYGGVGGIVENNNNDTSTTSSDTDQAEICIQYGLTYKNDQGVSVPMNPASMQQDWKYLLNEKSLLLNNSNVDLVSTSPQQQITPPIMQEESTTFSRFKRNSSSQKLKKENSMSSLHSLTPLAPTTTTTTTTRRKRLRNRFSRSKNRHSRSKKKKQQQFEAKFYSDIMGITFLEIESASDLPPEKNMTRTGFDMDPFVIVSYGTSTFRTRAIRHNLNPIWNEKLFFHVRNTQANYKIKFAVYDKDKFSGNDFVASQELSISDIINKMPPSRTSLFNKSSLPPSIEEDIAAATTAENPSDQIDKNMGRHTIPLNLVNAAKWEDKIKPTLTIRAKFVPYIEIRKMFWIALAKTCDSDSSNTMSRLEVQTMLETLGSNISETTLNNFWQEHNKTFDQDLTMDELVKSLESFMQMADEKMASRRNSYVIIEETAHDVPVDSGETKNPFFMAPSDDDEEDEEEEGYDDDEEEDQVDGDDDTDEDEDEEEEELEDDYFTSAGEDDEDEEYEYEDDEDDDVLNSHSTTTTTTTPHSTDEADYEVLAEGDGIQYIDGPLKEIALKQQQEKEEEEEEENQHLLIVPLQEIHSHHHHARQEKVIRLNECPICHKPNLGKRGQMDIVTHVATCAANDWTTVDRFLMGNFGSEAQAQRKWFVKLVNKVGYGKYSVGKNNANIIVQDRATGQLIDERMSVYIRLGMRLVYKGMRTGIQFKSAQRILANISRKQGRRFDNPLSQRDIPTFIKFHQLDMTQVLEPIENFKTFNQFFYRKLKPGARPCDEPYNPHVVVSPADCRMMAFPSIDKATKIWIKGTEFSVAKLLDDAQEAKSFQGGALAIFRLAPQDYHRYHSPVDGVVRRIHHVQGQYYTVNPMAVRTTLDVYGDNKRDIVYMDTQVFGKVAIVCIGAMMVGSIILTVNVGDDLARTDELGYFAFGGSTLVVLFEKNMIRFDKDLIENANNSLETLVRVGNRIGVHTS